MNSEFIGGVIVGVIGMGIIAIAVTSTKYDSPAYKLPRSSEVRMIDINKDGINDLVQRDGSVEFGSTNGTFTPFETAVASDVQEVINKYQKMIESYKQKTN